MDKKQFKDLYRMSIKLKTVYCCICGKPILKAKDITIEHKQPLSRGGANDETNWGCAHAKCNHRKGSLTMEEYRLWLELEMKRNGQKTH